MEVYHNDMFVFVNQPQTFKYIMSNGTDEATFN